MCETSLSKSEKKERAAAQIQRFATMHYQLIGLFELASKIYAWFIPL